MRKINLTNIDEKTKFLRSQQETSNLHKFLLRLFLPLDIDMQTLAIIQKEVKENEREEDDILDYLIDSKEPEGMLRGSVNYEQKLDDALQRVIRNRRHQNISSFLENSRDFMGMLDEMKEKVKSVNSEDDAKGAIKNYLNSKGAKFWDNVNSFHNWYCALAECLRGEEACK